MYCIQNVDIYNSDFCRLLTNLTTNPSEYVKMYKIVCINARVC